MSSALRLHRDIILASKVQHWEERMQTTPLAAVLAVARMQTRPRYILDEIGQRGRVALIAQVTRMPVYDPVTTALRCVLGGADAIAFFTDHSIYAQDLNDSLMVGRALRETPMLFQNYILNEYGVLAARAACASGLMLYRALLDETMLRKVVTLAQRWKMATVVQISKSEDLEATLQLSPHSISFGDIDQSPADALDLLRALSPRLPHHVQAMFTPALHQLDEVEAAIDAGAQAIIVHSDLFKSDANTVQLRRMVKQRA